MQLEAPLAGTEEVIQCSVKLTGPSVLQGVKQCIVSDSVTLPVPSVLSAPLSCCSNTVLVQQQGSPDRQTAAAAPLANKENNNCVLDKT